MNTNHAYMEDDDESEDEQDQNWGDIFSSEDDEEEFTQMSNDWTDVVCPITIISYDQAAHDAWELAKTEIERVRASILKRQQVREYSSFQMKKLVDYFIDRLWPIIERELNDDDAYLIEVPLTKEKFKQIFGTFLVMSSFNKTATSFYHNDLIKKDSCCTYKEYTQFWSNIAANDGGDYDNSKVYLWQLISKEINAICRDLFMREWKPTDQKHLTIDDDKDQFNGIRGFYETSGLRSNQLVRDNRKGFVFHTMVFSASGIPVGIEAELVSDSSSTDAANRLISGQLAPAYNYVPGKFPNLSNSVIYADRLYWTKNFLDDFIIHTGAEIGPSTHKREHSFPFTYDQKLTKNDTRELISKKGGRCYKIKEKRSGAQRLLALAYRDGRGNVPLGIASGAHGTRKKHWDIHFYNPKDRYKLLDLESGWHTSPDTWIRPNKGPNKGQRKDISQEFISLLETTSNVKAMTTEGSNDQAWFLARAFSFSSSTIDKLVTASQKVLEKCDRDTLSDDVLVTSLNSILKYCGKSEIQLQSQQEDVQEVSLPQEDVFVNGVNISNEFCLLNQNDEESTQAVLTKIENRFLYSNECVESLYKLLGGNPVKSRDTNISKIKDWIKEPIEQRKYMYLNRKELQDKCLARLSGSKTAYEKPKKKLIEMLLESDARNSGQINSQENSQEFQHNSLSEALTALIINSTFMKPITGQSRQHTRIGLDNEGRLLNKLFEDSKIRNVVCKSDNKEQIMHVCEINRPGMVRMIGKEYIKTSIDALGLVQTGSDDSDLEFIGIEVKTRTVEATRQAEIDLRNSKQAGHTFVKIPYNQAKTYIPNNHELIQILHHAFVYDLKQVLLLIGDQKGTILRGIWVEFDKEIKAAYNDFLARCYHYSLTWAYDSNVVQNETDFQETTSMLENLGHLLPKNMDVESFIDYYMMWKCATSKDEYLPIPRTKYIKPYHFAKWNKLKGGSDTLTKLFWNCMHYAPYNTPATNVLSHTFRFIAATLLRCYGVMTCNEDLGTYPTLKSWRTSNHTRIGSFDAFLCDIAKNYFCCKESNEIIIRQPLMLHVPRSENGVIDSPHVITPANNVWLSKKTFNTPQRKVAKQYNNAETDNEVHNRRCKCTGRMVRRVSVDDDKCGIQSLRGICAHCNVGKTSYFCMGCRHWLCITRNDGGDRNNIKYVVDEDGENIYFNFSCWHQWHETGIRLAESAEIEPST